MSKVPEEQPNVFRPPTGLTTSQEIVALDVLSGDPSPVTTHIQSALQGRARHRIVSMSITAYGEYSLDFRVLIVIEYL